MKKILLWSLVGVLVLGLVAVVVISSSLGGIVTAGVNSFGPKLTQTDVKLAGASISPLSGSGTLTGLYVGNPSGWKNDKAFFLKSIHVSVVPSSIMGDHIIINELIIDDPEFDYETKLPDVTTNNVSQLLANIEQFAGSGSKTPAAKGGQPVKIEVKKFRLTNAKVSVGVGGMKPVTVPMPDISMDNLGSDQGGITPDQLVGAVMKKVTAGIITAGKDVVVKAGTAVVDGAKDAVKGAADAAKNAVGGIKDLFGGSKK